MIAPTSFFADYGCHVRILEEIRALRSRGHRVRLCTYHNGTDVDGLDIQRTIDIPWRTRAIVGSSRHKLYLDAALSVTSLRAALTFRPDIIHAHLHEGTLIGGAVARLLGRPLVFDYQGSLTEEMLDHGFIRSGSVTTPVLRRIEHAIDRLPDLIITSTHNARAQLEARGISTPVRTVLDAVDTNRFAPDSLPAEERLAMRRSLGIPDEARVVTYLGLLAPYQGTDLLLRAARRILKQVPNAYFLVMGYPGVERYRDLAVELGIADRVSLPGRIPYAEAPRFLALGDLAVAPKMSLTEGNGKLYNYMAMGLPVVAFDTATNREILGDFGVYAPTGDERAFAETVGSILNRPGLGAELGSALRFEAQRRLAWHLRVEDLLGAYAAVLPETHPWVGRMSASAALRDQFTD